MSEFKNNGKDIPIPTTEAEAIKLKQGKGVAGAQYQKATSNSSTANKKRDGKSNKEGY